MIVSFLAILTIHLSPSSSSVAYSCKHLYTMAMLIPLLLPHVVAAGANIGKVYPLHLY